MCAYIHHCNGDVHTVPKLNICLGLKINIDKHLNPLTNRRTSTVRLRTSYSTGKEQYYDKEYHTASGSHANVQPTFLYTQQQTVCVSHTVPR
jgi:hypothetical protein